MRAIPAIPRRLLPAVLLALMALPGAAPARTVLEAGSATTWRFLEGTEPAAGWTGLGFDDAAWKTGPAPLGYGEARLGTRIPHQNNVGQPGPAWFRRSFVAPALAEGERAVIVLCADDGAVVHLNGREIGRYNMPKGPVANGTLARQELDEKSEGFYLRLTVPPGLLRAAATNVLAVEVHPATTNDTDLFFDLALKTVPPQSGPPKVTPAAKPVLETYHQKHYVGPADRVPDGYFDGGRHMRLDEEGRAQSGREILLVDRGNDPELQRQIAYAQSAEIRQLPELERVQKLAAFVDGRTTPPGGERWTGPTIDMITKEFANKTLRIGDVVEQSQAGVCRHRSLLFKILADEAGLQAALVRGNYAQRGRTPGFAHAWNEVTLSDGRRVLVDVMHNGGKPVFRAVTDPYVVRCYLREDDTPWYREAAAPAEAK
jgi:hypothetical protein